MTNRSCNIYEGKRNTHSIRVYSIMARQREPTLLVCISGHFRILQPFTAPDNNLREDWESDIRYAGKVYRRTYGAQKDTPYFIAGEDEYIPGLL